MESSSSCRKGNCTKSFPRFIGNPISVYLGTGGRGSGSAILPPLRVSLNIQPLIGGQPNTYVITYRVCNPYLFEVNGVNFSGGLPNPDFIDILNSSPSIVISPDQTGFTSNGTFSIPSTECLEVSIEFQVTEDGADETLLFSFSAGGSPNFRRVRITEEFTPVYIPIPPPLPQQEIVEVVFTAGNTPGIVTATINNLSTTETADIENLVITSNLPADIVPDGSLGNLLYDIGVPGWIQDPASIPIVPGDNVSFQFAWDWDAAPVVGPVIFTLSFGTFGKTWVYQRSDNPDLTTVAINSFTVVAAATEFLVSYEIENTGAEDALNTIVTILTSNNEPISLLSIDSGLTLYQPINQNDTLGTLSSIPLSAGSFINGSFTISGTIDPAAFPLNMEITGENFPLVNQQSV